jgi:hypothetical protein
VSGLHSTASVGRGVHKVAEVAPDVPVKALKKPSANMQLLIDFHNSQKGLYREFVSFKGFLDRIPLECKGNPKTVLNNPLTLESIKRHVPMTWILSEEGVTFCHESYEQMEMYVNLFRSNIELVKARIIAEEVGTPVRVPSGMKEFNTLEASVRSEIAKALAKQMGELVNNPTFYIGNDGHGEVVYFSATEIEDGKLTASTDMSSRFANAAVLLGVEK